MLRIVSAAALFAVLAVVAAGCGGGAAPERSAAHGVPQALAQEWERQASAVATAAAAGNDCRAMHLAASLRDEVSVSSHKLPVRLRSPLLTGVNALADRISTCTRTRVVTVPTLPKGPAPPPQGPKPKPPHGPPGHDKHDKHDEGGKHE